MRKVLLLLIGIIILASPVNVLAKVNIYFFRGYDCPHCEEALEYLNVHREEIPKNVEIITYEVWKNDNNEKLHAKLAEKLNVEDKYKKSVPFIVIGNEYIIGMSPTYSDFQEIITKAQKYDGDENYQDLVATTIKEMQKEDNIKFKAIPFTTLFRDSSTSTTIVLIIFGVIVVGFICLIGFSRKN